ncbi:MAG: M24 family metallopeptidase [Bryobacteraceae bacterium]|nr:M24 family metallopeptidase [Bryobacteraceae bacterium]
MRLEAMQAALRGQGLDGWLFFDHHGRDPLAYRILGFAAPRTPTRRWYYFVPAEGEPVKLVHRIEPGMLDALPGDKRLYAGWQEQEQRLAEMLPRGGRVAMQYSPRCAVPYIAMVDAGTVELVRALGVEVASSAALVQQFEALWTPQQYASHRRAQARVDAIRAAAFRLAEERLARAERVTESDIKQFILNAFETEGLFTDHGPIVAVNAHASDPHYEPQPESSAEIRRGDLLLIDLWAKLREPGSVYYDITWTAYCGATPPARMLEVFEAVAGARDAAVRLVAGAAARGEPLCGWQVDDAARGHLRERGLAAYFIHRTGHSIGEEVHGTGANMDNFETHDERPIVPGLCFSVEPGVYLPEFGIRSEVNVYRSETGAEVTGEVQRELLRLAV